MALRCRACLFKTEDCDSINIFTPSKTGQLMSECLTSFAQIEITNGDGLPDRLCKICEGKVNMLLDFRTMLIMSDRELRKLKDFDENDGEDCYMHTEEESSEEKFSLANEARMCEEEGNIFSDSNEDTVLSDNYEDGAKPFKCPYCDKSYKMHDKFQEHVKLHSYEEVDFKYDPPEQALEPPEEQEPWAEQLADLENEAAIPPTLDSLPDKSRKKYEIVYERFMDWCKKKTVNTITESVVLTYFSQKSLEFKSSTLWSIYSMLKATLLVKDNVDISNFKKLLAFLKRKAVGYRAKKSATFTTSEIERFLTEAPDEIYLMMKVALIMGVTGACRRDDLTRMSIDDIQDTGPVLIVRIPNAVTGKHRSFTLLDKGDTFNMVEIYRKYAKLRPAHAEHKRFFINYRNGKCSTQVVGMNTFGGIPCQIAKYLGLENPRSYTGHCFRRSSVILFRSRNSRCISPPRADSPENVTNDGSEQRCNTDASDALSSLLALKSKERYEKCFEVFDQWRKDKHTSGADETMLLTYFFEKAKILKASSLWSNYSMLKCMLQINEKIDISGYKKLLAFLKRQNNNYQPKKSKVLTFENVSKFLNTAPDDFFLFMKVVLVFGLSGACRGEELRTLTVDDIHDTGTILVVTLTDTRTKKKRVFTVTPEEPAVDGVELYRRYLSLRPKHTSHRRLFVCYRNGKCTVQPVGINTFYSIPKKIAKFLKLKDSGSYTGHCLRRTSATLLAESGADIQTLRRHGGWQSRAVAEAYYKQSMKNKVKTKEIIKFENVTVSEDDVIFCDESTAQPSTSCVND